MSIIVCTRKKTSRRKLENALENWAILGLARLWRGQACTGADDGFAGSIVAQWEADKKLSPRQWEAVVKVARRYTRQLGQAPDSKQGELL